MKLIVLKNLRSEIRKIIESHILDTEVMTMLDTFPGIVQYVESKVPLLKYYTKDAVFADNHVMKYKMQGETDIKQVSVQSSILKYEVEPSSVVYVDWNSYRSLKLEVQNNILFKLLSDLEDTIEKDAVSRVLHKNLADHSFTRIIRYNVGEMDIFKKDVDDALNEMNKSMVLFDEVMRKQLGYSLI